MAEETECKFCSWSKPKNFCEIRKGMNTNILGITCEVAVKQVWCNELNEDTKLLKEQEIRILKQCNHQNVVKLLATHEYNDISYMILERCKMNLNELIKKDQLNINRKLDILCQLADALHYLHMNNVIHGDIKPDNIMLSYCNQIKIIDFDGKLLTKRNADPFLRPLGTHGWNAPEVSKKLNKNQGEKQDMSCTEKSDIFSMGLVFFFVMTDGVHPFEHPNSNDSTPLGHQKKINADKKHPDFERLLTDAVKGEVFLIALIRNMLEHEATNRSFDYQKFNELRSRENLPLPVLHYCH